MLWSSCSNPFSSIFFSLPINRSQARLLFIVFLQKDVDPLLTQVAHSDSTVKMTLMSSCSKIDDQHLLMESAVLEVGPCSKVDPVNAGITLHFLHCTMFLVELIIRLYSQMIYLLYLYIHIILFIYYIIPKFKRGSNIYKMNMNKVIK